MRDEPKLSAYELLEQLQKKYLELKGLNCPVQLERTKVEDIIKGVLGEANSAKAYSTLEKQLNEVVLNTKYQDPYMYIVLNDIIQGIERIKADVFKGMDLDIKMPCFGTVEYDMFSAEICAPNCDEKLIIISNGLFTFANLISKVIAQVFPLEKSNNMQSFSTDIEKILRQIEDNTEIKLRFYDLMLACLVTREPPRARQYFIDSRLNGLLAIIRESFEVFVVAHEYSHSILGHLEDKKIHSTSKIDDLSDSEIKEIYHSWEEETAADLYGAGITMAIMNRKGIDRYVSMLGIIVCMNSLELFEKIEMLRLGKPNERKISKSHPPGLVKEAVIEQQYFKDKDISLFDAIDQIVSNLWQDFSTFFEKLNGSIERTLKRNVYEIPFGVTQEVMYRIMSNENQQV